MAKLKKGLEVIGACLTQTHYFYMTRVHLPWSHIHSHICLVKRLVFWSCKYAWFRALNITFSVISYFLKFFWKFVSSFQFMVPPRSFYIKFMIYLTFLNTSRFLLTRTAKSFENKNKKPYKTIIQLHCENIVIFSSIAKIRWGISKNISPEKKVSRKIVQEVLILKRVKIAAITKEVICMTYEI